MIEMLSNVFRKIRRPATRVGRICGGPFRAQAFCRSYSLEGEDMVLRQYLEELGVTGPVYYVDVGAFHPTVFSNTYFFYKQGGRGIAIDPNPETIINYCRIRLRDVAVQAAIAEDADELTYYEYHVSACNTMSKELVKERRTRGESEPVRETKIRTSPLCEILVQHLPTGQSIDVMDVDVEGFDLQVLRSNDWNRFRPRVVLVEVEDRRPPSDPDVDTHDDALRSPTALYLQEQGYGAFAKTRRTMFFVDTQANASA